MKVEDKKVVSVSYTLKNNEGTILDQSKESDPLAYIHGTGSMIAGFEKALDDKEIGAKVQTTIKPEDAYGVRDEKLVQQVPKTNFENGDKMKIGDQFQAKDGDKVQIATVTAIENENITVDMNHPLANETLHFDIEVVDIREVTEDELTHGHVHGAGGHHH